MNPLRLVLVTRRFWPLVGGPEKVLGNLAGGLAARGYEVTLLTARWSSAWPARITFRGVPVVRIPHPPARGLKTFRYVRWLARWLCRHEDRCDLVYVSMLKQEAYAAVSALGDRVPVVLRAERAGRSGDCLWQIETSGGRRIKRQCLKAAAFVGPSAAVERELKAAGYPRRRIHQIPDGVPIPPPRCPTARVTARAALAAANAAMQTPDWAQVALYTGRSCLHEGLAELVAAWQPVVARWPNARLWLAGEAPDRAALVRQIEAFNLSGRVLPVGVFDEVDELLAAADLFVLPSPQAGTSRSLLEAMAAGLPIVAGDTPGNRALITDGQHGLLVPPGDARAFSTAITRLFDQPDLTTRLAAAARKRAVAEFALAKMVDQHVTLFERLTHPLPKTPGA